MTRPPRTPTSDFVIFGPLKPWTTAHDVALALAAQRLGATVVALGGGQVAAEFPIEQFEGINRWRWVAAALRQPAVVNTPAWRTAALRWAPSVEGGTVRVITEKRWQAVTGRSA